jgi:hypothetical protein
MTRTSASAATPGTVPSAHRNEIGKRPQLIFDHQTAVSMADLDAACAYLHDIADIEDGGIAVLAISDVNFDWSAANQGERESASTHG